MEPGGSYRAYVDITNPTDATNTLHYMVSVLPYAVVGEDYEVDFTNESDYTAISKWVTIDEPEGYVEPNNVKRVYYTINVPENAPGGGQYCALAIRNVPEEETTTQDEVRVQDVLEIASVLYAQINGEITRDGAIENNFVPYVSLTNPLTTSVYLENQGNVHQDAKITLSVYSVFTGEKVRIGGGEEDVVLDEEEFGDNYFTELVMPETSKYVSHEIEGMPSLGVFRVSQTVSFAGVSDTNEQVVVMCPGWFIGLVVLTIVCLVVSALSRRRRRRRRLKKTP